MLVYMGIQKVYRGRILLEAPFYLCGSFTTSVLKNIRSFLQLEYRIDCTVDVIDV